MPIPAIRPVSDLRTDLNGVCDQARQTQRPIIMTKNGKASLVVMDCDAYERQRQNDRYVLKLREAEIEAQYHPEAVSQAQLDAQMERVFSSWR